MVLPHRALHPVPGELCLVVAVDLRVLVLPLDVVPPSLTLVYTYCLPPIFGFSEPQPMARKRAGSSRC